MTPEEHLNSLLVDPWDYQFVSNPQFKEWLLQQLVEYPIASGRPLLDYVTERLHAMQAMQEAAASGTIEPQQTYQSQPQASTSANGTTSRDASPPAMTINPSQIMPSRAASPAASKTSKIKKEVKQPTPPPSASNTRAPSASKAPAKRPSQPWTRVLADLKPYLDSKALTSFPNRSAKAIAESIDQFGPNTTPNATVPASGRLEITRILNEKGTKTLFQALNDQPHFHNNLKMWTQEALDSALLAARKEGRQSDRSWGALLVPVLKLWDQLPLNVDQVIALNLGQFVRGIAKEFNKDAKIHDREIYRAALALNKKIKAIAEETSKKEESKVEPKRKPEPPKADDLDVLYSAVKKQKLTSTTSVATTGTAGTKPAANRLGGLSGLSFGKKTPGSTSAAEVKIAASLGLAGTGANGGDAAFNPFAEAMQAVKGRGASVAAAAAAELAAANSKPKPSASTNTSASSLLRGKKRIRKSVKWAPEGQLEQIREIDRAIYEDDERGDANMHDVRAMDQSEGAALFHARHDDEDRFAWVEPQTVYVDLSAEDLQARVYPWPDPIFNFGASDAEQQAAREANTPAFIEDVHNPPWTPTEAPLEAIDTNVAKQMDIGQRLSNDPEYQALLSATKRPPTLAADPEISSLLAQLTPSATDPLNSLLASISSANPALLGSSQPGYNFGSAGAFGASTPAPAGPSTPAYLGSAPVIPTAPRNAGPPAGRGRAGRPDKRRQIPCKFFQTSDCMYGDGCPYLHVR